MRREEGGVPDYRIVRLAVGIDGVAVVTGVRLATDGDGVPEAVVSVRPFRCAPSRCGECGRVSPWEDRGEGRRRWRALDWGGLKVYLEGDAPRVRCAEHGVTVAAVPWARHKARHTREFDQMVAWLARRNPKSAVAQLMRVAWETVGSIIERVMADAEPLRGRWAGLRRIGIDEVAYRRKHRYLTVVVDHVTGRLLWAGQGRERLTLGRFFDQLGEERCGQIALVSADGADWIADMVGLRCPNALLCMDPFHAVKWMTEALDLTRRRVIAAARQAGDSDTVAGLKDSRWALLRNPADLTGAQRAKLSHVQKVNNQLYRAYLLKEQGRKVFAPGGEERVEALDEWLAWAARCQVPEFVELARRMRRYRDDIAHTLVHRLTNGPVEGLNGRVRLIINIARGFRSVDALIATINLHLGDFQPTLPGRSPARTQP